MQTIGRYFSVVSMVPSSLFVVYVYVLVRSGAWSHSPNWAAAVDALVRIGVGGAFVLIALGIALGVVVHPVQFGLVQFLEGYWGTNVVARKIRELRVRHHRIRADALEDKDVEGDQEAGRLLAQYPTDPALVMPTRLGNVLRKYEVLAGRQYELSVLTILPHIALAARPEDVRYLDDQRVQLDLAVRTCFTAALASVVSVAFLSRDGFWLFVAAIPGILAYVAYHGAVISAREYGIAMTTLVDLNRFSLYERLHLPMPRTIAEERITNRQVMQLMESSSTHVFMRYKHPSTADGAATSTEISNTPLSIAELRSRNAALAERLRAARWLQWRQQPFEPPGG
jgi:hypothetical protein